MAKFSKIYDRILDSTLWEESPEARLVFLGMTFASDMEGMLMTRTISALARRLNLTEDYVERGLKVITAPDPSSASKEHEGRRVIPIDGGWFVVTKRNYIDQRTAKQADWAEKKAAYRAKHPAKPKKTKAHTPGQLPDSHWREMEAGRAGADEAFAEEAARRESEGAE